MNNNHESLNYSVIKTFLNREGIQFTIAGGYPRDMHFGKEARDMDIIVYGFKDEDELIRKFNNLTAFLLQMKIYLSDNLHDDSDLGEYETTRISAVAKTCIDIDFIFYHSDYRTIHECIDAFDFNINQYLLLESGAPIFIGFNEGKLCQLRESEVDQQRVDKMSAIAKDYGWEVWEAEEPAEQVYL